MTRLALLAALLLAACATTRKDDPAYTLMLSLLRQHMTERAWPAAHAVAQDMLTRDAEDMDALALRGVAAREMGMLPEARADLEAAITEVDDAAWMQAELALVYERLREGALAEAAHRRAIELEPENPAHHNNLAFSLHARGRVPEAIESYRASLRIDPTSARVRNNLGFALAEQGDFKGAAAQFALGGSEAEAKNNLGFAYELGGNLAQARTLYAEALALDPALAKAKKNLLHVAQKLGEPIPETKPADVAPLPAGGP